jgi:hypothetical protein
LPTTSGTVITTGSTGQVINKASLPTGSVLQVVNATYSTETTSSSSTLADTGLTATITPTSTTSKILVLVSQVGVRKSGSTYVGLRLLRNSSSILSFAESSGFTGGSVDNGIGTDSVCYLDSPATTSATTYKTQFKNTPASGTVYVQVNGMTSTITLMEIAA